MPDDEPGKLHYDPFRGSETVTLQELLEDVFFDEIDFNYEGRDPFSGSDALTVNSTLFADEDRPLHLIARRGNAYCIKLLLEAGADPNAKGDMSFSPLHEAVGRGYLEVARLLLEAGARIDSVNEFGDSALGMCSPHGSKANPKMFRLLQSYWPGVTPPDARVRKYRSST
jgi:ankyrin repeat protein